MFNIPLYTSITTTSHANYFTLNEFWEVVASLVTIEPSTSLIDKGFVNLPVEVLVLLWLFLSRFDRLAVDIMKDGVL
jgi:hypothetical protein